MTLSYMAMYLQRRGGFLMVRMKTERLKRQWTQQDLGYHARVSAADVSRIESRRMQPYPRHAARLAKVLEITPEELLEEMEVEEHACDAAYTV
jgi:transcriptional regulator with XRE-family HTH domain